MRISFNEIVDVPALKRMVQANYDASGIPVGIIDAISGEVYAGAGWQKICTHFHRKHPESGKLCIESDTRITGKISRGEPHACKCKLGLWDIGIPILCDQMHLATIFLGQFLYEGEKTDQSVFIRQAERFGFPVDDYLAALDEVPVFSKHKVDTILSYNQSLAEFLSALATDRMRYNQEMLTRKKAEARLQKAKDNLERQVEARTRELSDTVFEFEAMFNSSQVGMMVSAGNLTIVRGNPYLADMLGYGSADEMTGLSIRSLLLPEERFHQFRHEADSLLKRGESVRAEHEIRRNDGTPVWCSFSGRIMNHPDSDVPDKKILWIIDDISERKRIENSLIEKEQHYHTLFEQSPDAIMLLDPQTQKAIEFNDLSPKLLGYSRQEFANLKISDYEAAENPEDVGKHIKALLTEGSGKFETRLRARDGSLKDVSVNCRVIDVAGEKVFHSIFHDITEQKRAESLQRFQAQIMSQVHDSVIAVDLDGFITSWNKGSENLFGYPDQEIIGKPVSVLYPVSSHPLLFDDIIPALLARGSHELETMLVRKGGNPFWARISLSVLRDGSGNITGMVGYSLDITDRKNAEERFEKFFSLVSDILCIADINGNFRMINPAALKILGYTMEELIGRPFLDFVHPEDKKKTIRIIEEKLEQGKTVLNFQNRYICKDGSVKWLEWNSHPSPDRKMTFAVARDCTERMRLEAALKKSELWLRNIFNSLEETVLVVSSEKTLINVNRAAEMMFGYTPEELFGKTTEILHVDTGHYLEFGKKIKQAFNQGKPAEFEFKAKRKTGEIFPSEHTVSLLQDESGQSIGIVSVVRDITERKQIEKFMHIQRDLGTALGGVEELEEVLTLFLDATLAIGDFDFGGVYSVDPLTGDLDLITHKGLPPELEKACRHYDGKSLHARRVVMGKTTFQSYDGFMEQFAYPPKEKELRSKLGLRFIAVIPILHKGKAIASLNIVSKKRDHMPESTCYSLEAVAFQVAGALARINANQALKESQRNLASLFQSMDDFLFVLDSSGTIIGFNPVVENRLGYPAAELTGRSFADLHPPDRRQEVQAVMEKMMAGQTGPCVIPFFTREGKHIPVETRITLGPWGNREAIFCISRDISERLEAEKARRLSEDRLQAAIETIDEGFALYDAEDRLALFNARYLEIYRESAGALVLGARFEDILREGMKKGQYADAAGEQEEWIARRMALHNYAGDSFEQKLSDGRWFKIAEKKMKDGSTVGFRVDITDIKRSEEHIRAALKEKEVLLREIHHRVKNNMQVVSSLLSLQALKTKNPNILALFSEAESRVHSMALVHEILYRSDNLSEINLETYLRALSNHLFHLYISRGGTADFKINSGGVTLKVEHAVPFGLIITELLTNALKYAIPVDSGLEIRIDAAYAKGNRILLTIADNGPGLPPGLDPGNANTLGLRLVAELVTDQLEGAWHLDRRAAGTCWVIDWPVI